MNCISMVDVASGWATGLLLGGVWFFIVNQIATSSNIKDVTYFSDNSSDKQQCKLEKKAFRCKARRKA